MILIAGGCALAHNNVIHLVAGVVQAEVFSEIAYEIGNLLLFEAPARNSGDILEKLGIGLIGVVKYIFHNVSPFFAFPVIAPETLIRLSMAALMQAPCRL